MRSRSLVSRSTQKPVPAPRPAQASHARAVLREIVLWTTRDGREIPLEDMSDEHVRNAIAALSRWRAGIKRKGETGETKRMLDDAIQRFRRILRRREKAAREPAKRGAQRRLGHPPRKC